MLEHERQASRDLAQERLTIDRLAVRELRTGPCDEPAVGPVRALQRRSVPDPVQVARPVWLTATAGNGFREIGELCRIPVAQLARDGEPTRAAPRTCSSKASFQPRSHARWAFRIRSCRTGVQRGVGPGAIVCAQRTALAGSLS